MQFLKQATRADNVSKSPNLSKYETFVGLPENSTL